MVIGAGPNGLVAANLLADEGLDVVVLEAQPAYGGAVRDAELTAPGFRTDLFSAFYPLSAASPLLAALGLEDYGLRWVHSPTVLTHLTPDGRTVTLSRDLDATAASVDAWAAGDGEAWISVVEQWRRLRPALLDALFQPFPPVAPALRLLRTLGPADALRFVRFLLQPVRRYGEETFRGDGARLLLAGNALHTDLSPESAGSAVFGWLLAMLGQDYGFPTPAGGTGRLPDALVARLRARGGEVVCSAPVTKVLVDSGRAYGVEVNGTPVLARLAVVADVPAPSLLLGLVGEQHLPARVVDDLHRFAWDDATVKVNWALRAPIPWTSPGCVGAGTVHLGVDLDGLSRFSADLATRRIPREPFVLLGQMTTTDPQRSPAGTESVWAYTHVPRTAIDDADALQAHVEDVEALVERHAPGFRASVIGRSSQLPLDLEAADANLAGGAINAGSSAIYQMLVFRPVPGLGRPELPIERLYLASASAHPGGGVHGAPGANAAKVVLMRNRAFGGLRGRLIDGTQRRVQGSPPGRRRLL
ncbi:MAG: NAD(P)/FAD-dependent oxidoreductase [Actinomycetota bacterium]|nr:NAD(P)/FAD-dependent oxidoreductase [Actinomycetota bacterium]